MADNAQNIQPQGIQQPGQPVEKPVREFIQVDTSTNAFMGKKIALCRNKGKVE
jgi:hypothetical protein